MNYSLTTRKLRLFCVVLLLLLTVLGFGSWVLGKTSVLPQSPKPKPQDRLFPTSFTPRVAPASRLAQVAPLSGCSGFNFSYGRGFAPDPATQARPISVVSGDFNKDGKLDLIATNLFANSMSVLLGDGTGGFSMPTHIEVVSDGRGSPAGLAVADFNNDGNLDLAVAIEYNPGRVFVLSGEGTGGFSVAAMLEAGVNTTAVAVGDFNGDSKPDLAAVNKGDAAMMLAGNVSVYVNNGSGSFGSAANFTAGTTPVAIVAGNFDNDSNVDLAVANSASNNLSLLAGNGAGSFGAATNINVGTNPSGLVAGFFNGDTRLDLAVTNTGSDNVSVLLANGAGGFGAPTNFASGITPFGIVVGDFDGNGKSDLAVANGFANQASVLLNDGSGGFGAPLSTSVGQQPLSLATGDFNGDTKADIAVANSNSNNLSILLGKGNGTFGRTTFMFSDPQAVVTSDFNKDGQLDFAVANFGGDKITVFVADLMGGYTLVNEFAVGIKPIAMAAGDFNQDGKLDLAVANNGSDNISLLLGDGIGSFGAQTGFASGARPRAIVTGDFNKDGKLDLITANETASNLTLLLGTGDGTFGAPASIAAGAKPVALDIGYLNNDDNLDLVVANLDSTFASVLLGNGSGGFSIAANVNLPGSGKGRAVALGDLNNDNKLDLLVALNSASDLAVALGNGDGTFAAPTTITTSGANPTDVLVGDFDGDSKADVVVTNNANDFVTIFPGKGDGTFLTAKTLNTGAGPVALDAGDLNNDKRLDIAVANSASNSVTLLLNNCANTPPTLTPAATITRSQGATAIVFTIANVSDIETAAGSLSFAALAPAGVTVSNITNTSGQISATIAADCTTAVGDKVVTLKVTDEKGLTTEGAITIAVTSNTPSFLGNYSLLEIVQGNSGNFAPVDNPNDNGTIASITATTSGFTGTLSVNTSTGVLTVNNAAPTGTFDVTITATDNCGLATVKNAQLKVVAPLTITSLEPNTKQAQSGDFTLTVNGSGFTGDSKVRWNGSDRATTFVSAAKLTAAIPAADINLNAAGTANITVVDPAAGGITSNGSTFSITAPNPAPTITSLNPTSAIAGDAGFTLQVNGSNFLSNSVVKYNGADRTTTFVSASQLTINVTAADVANPATAAIIVVNPAPGGGTSNTANLPINNPAPGAITLNPTAAIAGAAATTLTVNGTGFRPDSVIRVNNADRATTVVNATQVTTLLSVADLATAGTLQINVNTPPPGGGLSPAATFTINNPAPALTSLNPTSVLAGDAGFTLTLNGTGFVNTSQVQVNSVNRATTFASSTQLTLAITAADIANAGTLKFTVVNAAPGGGTSNELSLPINNPAPVLTALDKTSAIVGSAATPLTLTGSQFRPNSNVRVNGSDRATTFTSATQLGLTLTAADLATAGILKLSVFTPQPGGGTSDELNFAVNNPLPTLTSLNPATTLAGGGAFTLTLNGTGFVNGSLARFNGVDRATTVVNSTQATMQVTAAEIANAGSAKLTLFNPAPQGGLSNELTLAINNPAPSLPTLSQASLTAGTGATMLTLTGSGYRPDSLARVNGTDRTTTFVSATELKVNLLASDTVFGKTLKITVFTPAPGGGTSPEATLTVNNPAPTLTSLSPNAGFKGDPAFMLTVTGTNFVPTSVVYWNGKDRPTTFVSSTQLTAAIPQNDLAFDGTASVTVGNPAPGGGTSNAGTFKINLLTGFEADVTPRPNGDNKVSIADWVLVGRFATGLDTPNNSSEFQRADCAPLATNGDGKISITDWVQAGRFAVGLDPITPAAGPSQPASLTQTQSLRTQAAAFESAQPELTRTVRARATNFTRGDLNALPIDLDGQGNENGLAFSLRFDARQMLFSHVVATAGWTVNINASEAQQGRVGLMLVLAAGQVAQQGAQPVATAYFAALGGTDSVTTEVAFDDHVFAQEIADANATALPRASYENAKVTITGRGIVNVRAASYAATELASDSIASAFGQELASEIASANTVPLPTTLGGTRVQITDSKGVTKAAPVFFVSPSQINYLIPAGLADGIASVTVQNRAGVLSRGSLRLNQIAPSVFSADASGQGWAAAEVVRVASNGRQSGERIARYDANANQFVGVPIDFGPERGADSDQLYLILYATGLRQRAEVSKVKVKIGDLFLPVEYAGPQSEFAGLDQINVRLPRNLLGRGEVAVEVIVDGQSSNAVKVMVR